jgi:flagellar basal-body rod protein FlgF
MDNTSYVALSRQVSLERQMAVVAGNIANMNTHGYKTEQVVFESVLEHAGESGRVAFVRDRGLVRDLAPGPLDTTGNPLDLAINGEGYFTVMTEAGPRYTRGGHFTVDDGGRVAASGGHPLLDNGGAAIQLPPHSGPVSIGRDGTISTEDGTIGAIGLVRFADDAALRREGEGLLATAQPPEPVAVADIAQGRLERSNVQPIVEMTRMMETVRAFQNTQRLLETHHEMVRRVIDQASS